jgi:hypothetical protein
MCSIHQVLPKDMQKAPLTAYHKDKLEEQVTDIENDIYFNIDLKKQHRKSLEKNPRFKRQSRIDQLQHLIKLDFEDNIKSKMEATAFRNKAKILEDTSAAQLHKDTQELMTLLKDIPKARVGSPQNRDRHVPGRYK